MANFKVLYQHLPEDIWEQFYAFYYANFIPRNILRTFFLNLKVLQEGSFMYFCPHSHV